MSSKEDIAFQITEITPVYDYKNVAGGYFSIRFGINSEDSIKLSFVPFIDYKIHNDENLFNYLKKTAKDLTVSHAIFDLYDIGFPVDDWVRDYIEMAKTNTKAELFNTLIQFYNHIKNFNSGSSDFEDTTH
jgi:hypothetical protein